MPFRRHSLKSARPAPTLTPKLNIIEAWAAILHVHSSLNIYTALIPLEMSLALKPYIYQPLPAQHFRVLELTTPVPTEQDISSTTLTWSLRIVPFDDPNTEPVRYDALSYTWGDLSTTYPLVCDGQVLQIHHNLYEALPYLARRPSSLPLWIDALCINQSDESEKLNQIRQMSDIYRRASCVWVWLGVGEEPGSREAVESIIPRMGEINEALEALPFDHTALPSDLGLPEVDSPVWDAFDKILNSPWFERLWVVQEAALARDLKFMFGRLLIAEHDLDTAMDSAFALREVRDQERRFLKIRENLKYVDKMVFRCRDVYQAWEKSGNNTRSRIARLVGIIALWTVKLQCTNPRDRVFALLGLIHGNYAKEIQIYERITVRELYTQFSHFVLHREEGSWHLWDQLLHMAIAQHGTHQLASWCPDLHRVSEKMRYTGTLHGIDPKHEIFKPSSKQRLSRQGDCADELILRGCTVDTVDQVGQVLAPLGRSDGRAFFEWIFGLCQWELSAADLASVVSGRFSPSGNAVFAQHDYWNTLIAGQPGYLQRTELTFDLFLEFKSFLSDFLEITQRIGIERLVASSVHNETAQENKSLESSS